MTIAPFQQFMDAIDREIERRKLVLASHSRLLTHGELMQLTEDERRDYWRRNRFGEKRPKQQAAVILDFTKDDTQRDYARDDGVHHNYEHGE